MVEFEANLLLYLHDKWSWRSEDNFCQQSILHFCSLFWSWRGEDKNNGLVIIYVSLRLKYFRKLFLASPPRGSDSLHKFSLVYLS